MLPTCKQPLSYVHCPTFSPAPTLAGFHTPVSDLAGLSAWWPWLACWFSVWLYTWSLMSWPLILLWCLGLNFCYCLLTCCLGYWPLTKPVITQVSKWLPLKFFFFNISGLEQSEEAEASGAARVMSLYLVAALSHNKGDPVLMFPSEWRDLSPHSVLGSDVFPFLLTLFQSYTGTMILCPTD